MDLTTLSHQLALARLNRGEDREMPNLTTRRETSPLLVVIVLLTRLIPFISDRGPQHHLPFKWGCAKVQYLSFPTFFSVGISFDSPYSCVWYIPASDALSSLFSHFHYFTPQTPNSIFTYPFKTSHGTITNRYAVLLRRPCGLHGRRLLSIRPSHS